MELSIKSLTRAQINGYMPQLCALLANVVEDGASIGFVIPLAEGETAAYWEKIGPEIDAGGRVTLIALADDTVVGVGQLGLETRANGNHRAEIQKVMVHTAWRKRGIALRLMHELEATARQLGRTLLILDTRLGDAAENLYQKLEYVRAAEIPHYVTNAQGEYESTVIYYKLIAPDSP